MAGMGFFEKFNTDLMGKLTEMGSAFQSQFASDMMSLAAAAITLYVLWKGYQTLAGKTQMPMHDLAWDLSKFAIILTFVTNADGYLTAAIDALQGMKEGFTGGNSVWNTLDNIWLSTQNLSDKIYDLDTDYVPLVGAIGMLLVWAGSLVLIIVSTIVFLSADVVMVMMTITAPIFIFCLMFGFLRQMFNNWLQMLFSSVLTVLFASLVIRFAIDYQGEMMVQMLETSTDANIITTGAMGLMTGVLAALVVGIAAKIATALAGAGVEGAVQGAAMMGIGMGVRGVKKLANTAKSGAGRLGNAAVDNRERMWNNATPGNKPSGGGMAERRRASIENAKRRNAG